MPYERIKEEIRRRKPDIVGIANPFTCQVEHAIRVGNTVKEIALLAVKRYKRLSLINYFKSPRKTLKAALSQPKIVLKFIQNLTVG
jgi:hypothetical protein